MLKNKVTIVKKSDFESLVSHCPLILNFMSSIGMVVVMFAVTVF